MNYWGKPFVLLLIAFAAIQVVCSSPYSYEEFGPVDVEEDITDYRYQTKMGRSMESMGVIKCSSRMCCPMNYICIRGYRCKNLFRYWVKPQMRCPSGVELAA